MKGRASNVATLVCATHHQWKSMQPAHKAACPILKVRIMKTGQHNSALQAVSPQKDQ